jgi:hypothetical protein
MGKFISNMFLAALAIGLSIFTGSRTLDLLAWALPANQAVYQWLGLAAFEGGMYFWAFYFVYGAKGTPQRSIAIVMAVFSIVAVCVATIADLSLSAAQSGKIAPLSSVMQQSLIIFLGVVIVCNVAAFLACKLMSIEKLKEAAEQNAEDMIHAAGLKAIVSLAPHIAGQAAPYLAEEWANRTWQRLVPGAHGRTEYLGPVASPAALPPAQPVRAAAPAQLAQTVPASVPPATGGSGMWERVKHGVKSVLPGKSEALPVYNTPPQIPQDQLNQDFRRMVAEERARKRVTNAPASHPAPAAARVQERRKARRAARYQVLHAPGTGNGTGGETGPANAGGTFRGAGGSGSQS